MENFDPQQPIETAEVNNAPKGQEPKNRAVFIALGIVIVALLIVSFLPVFTLCISDGPTAGCSRMNFWQMSGLAYEPQSPYNNLPEVPSEDFNMALSCVNMYAREISSEDIGYVIDDRESYEQLLSYKRTTSICENFTLPEIDFSEKTLLARGVSSGGCNVNFERHVYQDEANKEILFSIDVDAEGACEVLVTSMNWTLIPKIPEGYSVVSIVDGERGGLDRLQPPQPTTDVPRVISCNPRGYDPTYFQQEKPCISDMTAEDIERENKALSIIEKSASQYCSLPELFVSDTRYPLVKTNCAPSIGYVVVDLVSEKVTDFFKIRPWTGVEQTTERLVFLEPILSSQRTVGERVRSFIFGNEKSKTVTGSDVYYPQSYIHFDGPVGFGSVNIIESNELSITLGVYDKNKSAVDGDTVVYEQIGTKIIEL